VCRLGEGISRLQAGEEVNKFGSLGEKLEGGEYSTSTFSEEEAATLKAKEYGRIAALTRKALINDNLDIFGRLLMEMGASAARLEAEQKAERAGKRVVAVNPAYTSQRCNRCGHTEKANRPKQDTFRCQSCGHTEHADLNAARNILEAGLALSGRGALRNPEPRSVAGNEASTHLNLEALLCAA
jgi:tRNA(Ile2) C34 agmatinyltransferase TiaS